MKKFLSRSHILSMVSALFLLSSSLVYAVSEFEEMIEGLESWSYERDLIPLISSKEDSGNLLTQERFGDSIVHLELELPKDAESIFLFQGRYALNLKELLPRHSESHFQSLEFNFRAVRYSEGRIKTENAAVLDIKVNGKSVRKNIIYSDVSEQALYHWEQEEHRHVLVPQSAGLKVSRFDVLQADYSAVKLPSSKNESGNIDSLVDYVALGKQYFTDFGCTECHSVIANDTAVKTGPNLFGLMQRHPRDREIVESGENHRFKIKANDSYLMRSVRTPQSQLAVAESGGNLNKEYPAIMPAYGEQIISDKQVLAIGDYLKTLNEPRQQGPVVKLLPDSGPEEYFPMEDTLQFLVADKTRIQRGPMVGTSGRAIHVGLTNGSNYSFDPRVLAVVKMWQGGFLDMSGELQNRGGGGLSPGFDAQDIDFGEKEFLFAPLDKQGNAIDFSFKEAVFRDAETILKSLNSKRDHLEMLRAVDAQFMGYSLDSKKKLANPTFSYRVGDNLIDFEMNVLAEGSVQIQVSGAFKSEQAFAINENVLGSVKVSTGKLENGKWKLPAGNVKATLTAQSGLSSSPWIAKAPGFNYYSQKLEKRSGGDDVNLPQGYEIESYMPPKDNYGRNQLFEALGMAEANDGTIVVSTRTAGIWRLKDDVWSFFAEGAFDSLGVVIEDDKGLVLTIGQKAELTRIADTNGDGIADSYKTLFDSFSYHGNYHTYLHGPLKTQEGKYFITLNLAHADDPYKAGGGYMGTYGGYSGWGLLVEENGNFTPWASGLRSPAGMGMDNEGTLWYTDNQGEFVATSKMFKIKKGAFYGHPAGLVDLPGMQPNSKAISWDKVKGNKETAAILFPHALLANSPGNLQINNSKGKFGPFEGQWFMGDQTLSNLSRIVLENVDGVDQGAVIPFASGLESGVMRPVFLKDGSLLLGQTGRGWQAQGGNVASMQRISWKPASETKEIIEAHANSQGFKLAFSYPLEKAGIDDIKITSWVYRDAPDYGSEQMAEVKEVISSFTLSDDKKELQITLKPQKYKKAHPEQTARVYHIELDRAAVYKESAQRKLELFFTVNRWALSN